jgi:hypothetical protein
MRRILAVLFGSIAADFHTAQSIDEAVSQLRSATTRSVLQSMVRESACGTVTADAVSLQRVIPFVGNSFKPFYIGRFESHGGSTVLRGAFTMSRSVKVFMSFWFGFCLIWTLLATAIVLKEPTEVWFLPFAGLGMLAAGALIVQLGKWFARNDQAFLSQVIRQALNQSAA